MIFLLAGLKYQDMKISMRRTNEGAISLTESPDEIWDIAAPDMAKKKPA
jgi:hypothetical protein